MPRLKKWYGSAGASMKTERFQETFDRGNTKAGELGEQILEAKLQKNFMRNGVTGFSSLKLPKSRGDVDFVLVSGRTVLLVDAKLWKTGAYSMKNDMLYRDGEIYDKKPSRNMTWAVKQLQELLGDDYTIVPMIVLVEFEKQGYSGKKVTASGSVKVKRGTAFPGGVPLYNQKSGLKRIRGALIKARFTSGPGKKDAHEKAVAKLRKLVQEV